VRNRFLVVACVLMLAGVAGCAQAQTASGRAAHLTIDGTTHAARPAECSQEQSYRTIDIRDDDGRVEAVVLLSGDRAIPEWVKIRNIDGFTGSYWAGGVGEAHADITNDAYTISGSAYGIGGSNPNKVVTTEFKITAEC
jgi:hypothetical protein